MRLRGRPWLLGALVGAVVLAAQLGSASIEPARALASDEVSDVAVASDSTPALVADSSVAAPASAVRGEPAPAFAPAAPADFRSTSMRAEGPTRRQAGCRPSSPAVGPTPGQSVAIYRGPAECNAVSLTFDAGADRGVPDAGGSGGDA